MIRILTVFYRFTVRFSHLTIFFWVTMNLKVLKTPAKKSIVSKLGMPGYYYSIVRNNWRFLVLDGTELQTFTIPLHPELKEEGDSIRLSVAGALNAAEWNGGISKKQQTWIRQQLTEAYLSKQEVIVFCHFPVYPEGHSKNLWNSQDIIDILDSYPNVVAYIAGTSSSGQLRV